MIAIIAKDVCLYTFPLGKEHAGGYKEMVERVCQVFYKRKNWTGFLCLPESALSTGFLPHGSELELEFPHSHSVGFLTGDYGDVIEMGVARAPKVGLLYSQYSYVRPGQVLFSIGSFLGIPYTFASCVVEKIILTDRIVTDERMAMLDEHSVGSPVFNQEGSLVGIVEAYVERTDRLLIRSLIANANWLLK